MLEYDGTDLCGWQRQDNGPTVQGHLEQALHRMTGAPTPVTGASRTDAGVHALGQVAHFATDARIPTIGFRLGLNSLLPPAIAVVAADEVDAGFHARFSASGKHYRYSLLTRSSRSPLVDRRTWHRPGPTLDVDAMRAGAVHLVGERDFSAMRASGCTAHSPTRRVDEIAITEPTPDRLDFDVHGNAFLRNMVRILVGTLVEVGEGRFSPAQVAEIMASRDRTRAGQTAPARGLCLVEVLYARPTG
ncbi:MAG TPA: tRNA pseudouridine(38-40) synthase TruA [Kofleriaceae bacterium]|nr:tRNA pseudouridine(38-40) synthase TruA [Kofleriaceae bacterium]